MDTKAKDRLRWFQGARLEASARTRKAIAAAWRVTRQAVDAHVNGKAGAISYDRLAELARDPNANPYAVLSGAAVVIEEARAKGDTLELAQQLNRWLAEEQGCDGREDTRQMQVQGVLGALAFMRDNQTVAFRRKATVELDGWMEEKLREVDAALCAIGYARALRAKLEPVEVAH